MEMMALAFGLLCFSAALWQWLRCRRMQKDVYHYAQQLDEAIGDILDGKSLNGAIAANDDLWGHTNERLLRLSQVLKQERTALTDEKESIKALVADISHQTKTPLANICLYLEQMEGDAETADLLPKMEKQVDKLQFLLEDMVKISRLETGAVQIHKQSVLLMDTLADAMAAVVPKAEQKHITLSVEADDTLVLSHDRKWTAEALYNLLDNAVKYTAPGGQVMLTVQRLPMFTQIHVRDNGRGIDPSHQGAIFTRFYREPEVHNSEGAGLGLYVARKIVALQGGYIDVHSTPGQGSVFTLNLPNESERITVL